MRIFVTETSSYLQTLIPDLFLGRVLLIELRTWILVVKTTFSSYFCS